MEDFSDAIAEFQQDFTVLRRGAMTLEKGSYKPGAVTAMEFTGAVHPARGPVEVAPQAPAGTTTREEIMVFTMEALRAVEEPNQHAADLVLYEGAYYEVKRAEPWLFGQFWRSRAERLPHSAATKNIYFGVGLAGADDVEDLDFFPQANRDFLFDVTPEGDEKVLVAVPDSFGNATVSIVGDDEETFSVTSITVGGVGYKLHESASDNLGDVTVRVR